MESNHYNRTLALAAVFQNAYLVRQIAWHGHCDQDLLDIMVSSLLTLDADSIEDVYGNLSNLRKGLEICAHVLLPSGSSDPEHVEVARYSIVLLFLQRKLMKRPDMLDTVKVGIEAAIAQTEYFDKLHENVIARLAETYQTTISQMPPRIMIQGEQEYLSNRENADRIRTLLLSGIRAALLWQQSGGSQWRMLFSRAAMQREASKIVAHLVDKYPDQLN